MKQFAGNLRGNVGNLSQADVFLSEKETLRRGISNDSELHLSQEGGASARLGLTVYPSDV